MIQEAFASKKRIQTL